MIADRILPILICFLPLIIANGSIAQNGAERLLLRQQLDDGGALLAYATIKMLPANAESQPPLSDNARIIRPQRLIAMRYVLRLANGDERNLWRYETHDWGKAMESHSTGQTNIVYLYLDEDDFLVALHLGDRYWATIADTRLRRALVPEKYKTDLRPFFRVSTQNLIFADTVDVDGSYLRDTLRIRFIYRAKVLEEFRFDRDHNRGGWTQVEPPTPTTKRFLQPLTYVFTESDPRFSRTITISAEGKIEVVRRVGNDVTEHATGQLTRAERTSLANLCAGWDDLETHYRGRLGDPSWSIEYGDHGVSVSTPHAPARFRRVRDAVEQFAERSIER